MNGLQCNQMDNGFVNKVPRKHKKAQIPEPGCAIEWVREYAAAAASCHAPRSPTSVPDPLVSPRRQPAEQTPLSRRDPLSKPHIPALRRSIEQVTSTSAHVDRAGPSRSPSTGAAPARRSLLDSAPSTASPSATPSSPLTSPSMAPSLSLVLLLPVLPRLAPRI